MTPGQKRAFREQWDRFGISFRYGEVIDLNGHFACLASATPVYHLEIGFGMGENLVHQASRWPQRGILGMEVHKPGIGAALKKIADCEAGIENIRVMRGDARLILTDYLDSETKFQRVSVLFPDPWPDEESAHRRIIQAQFLDLIETRIEKGGHLHIATDIDLYRDHCEAVMAERDGWFRLKPDDYDLEEFRGPTRYEEKGIDQGHVIHDLIFRAN